MMHTINPRVERILIARMQRGLPVKKFKILPWISRGQPLLLFLALLLVWVLAPIGLHQVDETAAGIDQSIWLLIILSLIAFLFIAALCWWLLQRFWLMAGLPPLLNMVSSFQILPLWQQLSFYWASFFLLLLAATICLVAVC